MNQWIELDQAALRKNITVLQAAFPEMECWPCLKANAYGHGLVPVAESIDDLVHGFTVVSSTEGLALRELTDKTIVVLNIVEPEEIAQCVQGDIFLPLASAEQLEWYKEFAQKIHVHLELDTGMARTGFKWESVDEMEKFVDELPKNIIIEGLFSHFAAAGEDLAYTQLQHERFMPFVHALTKRLKHKIMIHMDKSASALMKDFHHPDSAKNAFRPGISVYGFNPEWGVVSELKPILAWKTRVISVRNLGRGESVGYGLTFTAERDTCIATIPVGYADGYDRGLSNNAQVLVGGVRCPVRGRICMNLTMIEVPSTVKLGDEVVLIGHQGREQLSAPELARWAQTTPYEIVTRLNAAITRVVLK